MAAYGVRLAHAGISDKALKGLARCQDALACHHWELYQQSHPELTYGDWERMLSCGRLREFITQGVGVLYAYEASSGEVVGYLSYSRLPAAPAAAETPQPSGGEPEFVKVNHLVVIPERRGQGAGRHLMDAFLAQVGITGDLIGSASASDAPEPNVGVQIIAAELNEDVIAWYRTLGFRTMDFHNKKCQATGEQRIGYVDLRRCWGSVRVSGGTKCAPHFCRRRGRLFGEEICGETVKIAERDGQPGSHLSSYLRVLHYDDDRGLHLLEGLGAWVDLSAEFASAGGARFGRPLHELLAPGRRQRAVASAERHSSGRAGDCNLEWRSSGQASSGRSRSAVRGGGRSGGAARSRSRDDPVLEATAPDGATEASASARVEETSASCGAEVDASEGDEARPVLPVDAADACDDAGDGDADAGEGGKAEGQLGCAGAPAGGADGAGAGGDVADAGDDAALAGDDAADDAAADGARGGERAGSEEGDGPLSRRLRRRSRLRSRRAEESARASTTSRRRVRTCTSSRSRAGQKEVQRRVAGECGEHSDSGPDEWEDWPCRVCGLNCDDEAMILCDGRGGTCNAPYHYYCVGEPCVPEGKWFCSKCVAEGEQSQQKDPRAELCSSNCGKRREVLKSAPTAAQMALARLALVGVSRSSSSGLGVKLQFVDELDFSSSPDSSSGGSAATAAVADEAVAEGGDGTPEKAERPATGGSRRRGAAEKPTPVKRLKVC